MSEMECPRRRESAMGMRYPGPDRWRKPGDTCTYCGSYHPDKLMERLEKGDIKLGPTDKSYKVYLRNHGGEEEPGIKFYFQHFSREQCERFVELLNEKKLVIDYPGYFYVEPFFMVMREPKKWPV